MDRPVALKVQWLEQSLLVHGVTRAAPEARAPGMRLPAVSALIAATGALAAAAAGHPALSATLGALGLGGAALVVARAVRARAETPPPRRLLFELAPDRVAWTALVGDRWSTRHDHQATPREVISAVARETAQGAELRVRLTEGRVWDVPLHGFPREDAEWLAARVDEAITAEAPR